MAIRNGLRITDDTGTVRRFQIAPVQKAGPNGAAPTVQGRMYSIATRPWEPGDPKKAWRIPIHPFDAGLRQDKMKLHISPYSGQLINRPPRTYAKANADGSWPGLLLPPPLITAITLANGNLPAKVVEFNSLLFFVGGRYMYYVDPATNTATQDKDFGVGKAAVDACVFNGELIVAMGETEKIYKRTTAGTWTQATDATYAIALGVVNQYLWRAETTNLVSNCSTTPLTLANWTPASPNQYVVGDSTYAVHTIIDYGGIPWCLKGDGAYAPDPQSRFKNQTPQLRKYPNANNGKGVWVGQGYLWIPSAAGLLRIKPGESKIRGPELSGRPDFRFWVRGGVEFGQCMYLLCTDESGSSNTCIIKMVKDIDNIGEQEYLYHEWADLPGTTKGYCIGVTTVSTNPELFFGYGNNVSYLKLGRGGGRDVDDANYAFGTATTIESGVLIPDSDLSVVHSLVGVQTVLKFANAGETLSLQARVDNTNWFDLLDNNDAGAGSTPIQLTTNYQSVTRYAPPNTRGQMLEVKLTGALTSASGTTRPEVREVWAFGYSHPRETDFLVVNIIADPRVRVDGMNNGISRAEHARLFRHWCDNGIELLLELADYEEGKSTRFFVREVDETENDSRLGAGDGIEGSSILKVTLVRVDHQNGYAAA